MAEELRTGPEAPSDSSGADPDRFVGMLHEVFGEELTLIEGGKVIQSPAAESAGPSTPETQAS